MKTQLIILTNPTSWNFTDERTGQFRQGISAFCYLPNEGALQSFSNLPAGCTKNMVLEADCGFKATTDRNGKPKSELTLISAEPTGKVIDWASVLKK